MAYSTNNTHENHYDIAIIGGGINGCGIARDAAGRGLKVLLVEQHDIAAHTSSWSSKLIHGGLRYLEQYEFKLVREALQEREVLKRVAPHITRPLSFVLPHDENMRPAWMLRIGLWIYDHLGGKMTLPKSRGIRIPEHGYGAGLAPRFKRGFVYSDLQVDDSRLTLLNAIGAREKGADIFLHTQCVHAQRDASTKQWALTMESTQSQSEDKQQWQCTAKAVVNAAGPWVKHFLDDVAHEKTKERIKLVRGSHIVLPRALLNADNLPHAFILQNHDKRVIFVIPFAGDFSLVGTTDVSVTDVKDTETVSETEIEYLLDAVNRHFTAVVKRDDIVWEYAGSRPLYDDGTDNPSQVTRDYVLKLSAQKDEAPLLSIFGGKITTYRHLALNAMEKLLPYFPQATSEWTHLETLPGGDIESVDALEAQLSAKYLDIKQAIIYALVRRHGSGAVSLLQACNGDLGEYFGATLTARELDHMVKVEWARNGDDVMWRRSKAGLKLTTEQVSAVDAYVKRAYASFTANSSKNQ